MHTANTPRSQSCAHWAVRGAGEAPGHEHVELVIVLVADGVERTLVQLLPICAVISNL